MQLGRCTIRFDKLKIPNRKLKEEQKKLIAVIINKDVRKETKVYGKGITV